MHRRRAVALLVMGLVVGGCGSLAAHPSDCEIADGKAVAFSIPGEMSGRGAVSRMSVFRRATRSTDAVPSELPELRERTNAAAPGTTQLPDRSRLLLSVKADRVRLYAVPLESGGVCWGATQLTQPYGSGCTEDFDAVAWDAGGPDRCAPVRVVGIVPDRVASVDVVVRGKPRRAVLGSNAFFYELRDPGLSRAAVDALVVRIRDDGVYRVNFRT